MVRAQAHVVTIALLSFFSTQDVCGEDSTVEPINDKCLTCICHGASGCQQEVKCDADVCGIFAIGYEYWRDSGRPTLIFDNLEAEGAYERCVSDPYCGAKTVAYYMKNFSMDCNGDGKTNCWDYAGIHNQGLLRCSDYWDIDFERNYKSCMSNKTMLKRFDLDN